MKLHQNSSKIIFHQIIFENKIIILISFLGITEKTNNNPPSVTSPECIQISSSTSCSVSHILPTVKEDSELSISSATLSQSNKSASASSYGARPKAASMSKSLSALPSKPGVTESHPVVPLSSSSYPYHAHSSNWNPVSRQDSELQSQSSGNYG